MARQTTLERLEAHVRYEREWLQERGGSLAGYVERYGPKPCPTCRGDAECDQQCKACGGTGEYVYGDGGAAIYAADKAALEHAEAELGRAQARARRK